MLPVQHSGPRRRKLKYSQAPWQAFLILLSLSAAGLIYFKYRAVCVFACRYPVLPTHTFESPNPKLMQAGRRGDLAAQLKQSRQLADSVGEAAQVHTQTLSQLEQQLALVKRELDSLHNENSPPTAACRLLPPPGQEEHRAAILVPYRNREKQLSDFLPQLSDFLKVGYGYSCTVMGRETLYNRDQLESSAGTGAAV